ncbi:MAG: hypothetical protein M1499_09480 [Firmicutes bacterium]|nr:hypothetical protein [Bacillota bacterium]
MEFERITRTTHYLDPRKDYQQTTIESEIRRDPLTGMSGRIAHFAGVQFPEIDLEELSRLSLSRGPCPFCPELVEQVTPKFPSDISPQGRFRQGEAIVFPNLSPYDTHSAVTVMTKAHLVPVGDLTPQRIQDALSASVDYFRAVNRVEHHMGYGLISWNYFPMAGASLLHPHLQIYATDHPGNFLGAEIEAGKRYREQTGHIFWEDLIAEERRRGERYVGAVGNTEWLMPFVPQSFVADVQAIFPGRYSILDLTTTDLRDFALGLQHIFRYMEQRHIYSFNVAFFPGAAAVDDTWVHARLSFRGMFNPLLHSADVSAIRQLYDEPFTTSYPEEVARDLAPMFNH